MSWTSTPGGEWPVSHWELWAKESGTVYVIAALHSFQKNFINYRRVFSAQCPGLVLLLWFSNDIQKNYIWACVHSCTALLTKETGALSLSVGVIFDWLGSSKPEWLGSILCLATKRLGLLGEVGRWDGGTQPSFCCSPGMLHITMGVCAVPGCRHWGNVIELPKHIQSVVMSLMTHMTDQWLLALWPAAVLRNMCWLAGVTRSCACRSLRSLGSGTLFFKQALVQSVSYTGRRNILQDRVCSFDTL